uniref:Uncharacterized protein n=1 Tax=Ditylenchus dipsaci TaxID=166011 RepID=A0A915CTX3_9BILA
MGIDLCHKFDRKVRRTAPRSWNEKKIAVCVGPSLTTIESIKFLPLRWLLCVLRPARARIINAGGETISSTNWPFVRPKAKTLCCCKDVARIVKPKSTLALLLCSWQSYKAFCSFKGAQV